MRKISLILAICFSVISAPTMAQNVTYACQYLKSGGFTWENKNWKLVEFNIPRPFFLAASSGELKNDSIAKVMEYGSPDSVICHPPVKSVQTCSGFLGDTLIFNFDAVNGGVARINGATESDDVRKSSLVVRPFTCTKM